MSAIASWFNRTFAVRRSVWGVDGDLNPNSEEQEVSTLQGHLQQAQAELVQDLNLSMTKAFTIWCPPDSNVILGDRLINQQHLEAFAGTKASVTLDIVGTVYQGEKFTIDAPEKDPSVFQFWSGGEGLEGIQVGIMNPEATSFEAAEALVNTISQHQDFEDYDVTFTQDEDDEDAYHVTISFPTIGVEGNSLLVTTDMTNGILSGASFIGGADAYTEGDYPVDATSSYTVRAIQKRMEGENQHLQLVVEQEEPIADGSNG